MKVTAPLVLALLAVVSAQPFQEGLSGRPAKRGQQAQLEKNDVYADKQAWKRTGDWHDHHGNKCSDFYCRLQCKNQGFCRSECRNGKCKCSVRRDRHGKCNVPSKKPQQPKPTNGHGHGHGHGHGRGGNDDDDEE